jgi:hypothetical protein
MSATSELLNKLNVLRAANNKPQLKSWKESRAKLEAAIASLEASTITATLDNEPDDYARVFDEPVAIAEPQPPNDGARKPKPVREIMDDIKAGTITLADIARELQLNPKVLRAKMRRLTIPPQYVVGKHTYYAAHKDAIIEIIKRDHRRK